MTRRRGRGSYSDDGSDRSDSEESKERRRFSKPKTLQSWIVGVLGGGQQGWLNRYIESEFYANARDELKNRTGFDVQWLVTSLTAFRTAHTTATVYLPIGFDHLMNHATSSIEIDRRDDGHIGNSIFKYVEEQKAEESTSWLTLSGYHLQMDSNKNSYSLPENVAFRLFWYNGIMMILEIPSARAHSGDSNHRYRQSTCSSIILRCLGKNNDAIKSFLSHLQEKEEKDDKLSVTYWYVDRTEAKKRTKRPLSSIDVAPAKMNEIRKDAERYFHPSSQMFYEATGNPYRRGFLLYGPPGTGKTSLSVALASDFNFPLWIISLAKCDDKDLQRAFELLPSR